MPEQPQQVTQIFPFKDRLAVALPPELARQAGIEAGRLVRISLDEDRLVIQLVREALQLSLEEQRRVDELYAQRKAVFKKLAE